MLPAKTLALLPAPTSSTPVLAPSKTCVPLAKEASEARVCALPFRSRTAVLLSVTAEVLLMAWWASSRRVPPFTVVAPV